MTVSVVIPSYNSAQWLPEAIESVLRQTMKPYEIIVVDDGSTDNTHEVVQGYPIRYIHQSHAGVSAARNRGIQASSGDWIALLDADDCWQPEKLAVQSAAIRDESFCYCATTSFFPDGSTFDLEFFDHSNIKAVLRSRCVIETGAVLVKRDALIQAGGFNENMAAGEDWEMWIKLSLTCKFVGVPRRLFRYRCGGISASSNPEIFLQSIDPIVSAATTDLPPLRRFIEGHRLRSDRVTMAAIKYRQKGDYRRALLCAFKAFSVWPSPFYGTAFKLILVELRRIFTGNKTMAGVDLKRT